jgi:hypothetical protein
VYGGVPQSYRQFTYEQCAQAVAQALASMRPARVGFAETALLGVAGNTRLPDDPTRIDPAVSIMLVTDSDRKPIATLSNFALHADYLYRDNTLISADFPYFFCHRVEEEIGGMAMYLNGAQGDVYPLATIADPRGEKGQRTFAEAEKAGCMLADVTLAALPAVDTMSPDAPLTVKTRTIQIPVNNRFLRVLQRLRIIKRKEFDGHVQSEVWTMRIGPAQFVTLPGQGFYDIGLALKERMDGTVKFIIGQGNDEISYIVPPWRWEKEVGYEEGVSLGPNTWSTIEAEIPW